MHSGKPTQESEATAVVKTAAAAKLAPCAEVACEPTAFLLSVEVIHSLAGRVRLRISELLHNETLSAQVADAVAQIPGVRAVRANYWCASVVVEYDGERLNEQNLLARIRKLQSVVPASKPSPYVAVSRVACLLRTTLRQVSAWMPPVVQMAAGALSLVSALIGLPAPITIALTSCAVLPIGGRALETAVEERRVGVDGLDGLAAVLMIARGSLRAASFMVFLIGLGEYIRDLTASRCQKIMDDLLGLAGSSAWVVRGKKRVCIPAEQVRAGDTIVVYTGELIPVDGKVESGQACINQATITGEAAPVEVGAGNQVLAGTLVVEGKIYVHCTHSTQESRAGRMLELVKAAPVYDTRTQNYAAAAADRLVLPIMATAVAAGLLSSSMTRLMSVLIFDFSTGIRVSAPTAILASMQRAGQQGILIKSGRAIEKLAEIDAVVLDKTGTLTLGEPRVTEVIALNGLSAVQLLSLSAAVEERMHHPAARAIVRYARQHGVHIPDRAGSSHRTGLGAGAHVDGRYVQVGSRRMMEGEGIDVSVAEGLEANIHKRGESLAYVAVDRAIAGVVSYSDQLRDEAPEVIAKLRRRGIKRIFIATGDNEASAMSIADQAGIAEVFSSAFPEHKADLVRRLKEEGYKVAVVGDGVNDSAALVHADLGVSLHSAAAAAREHADVLLTDNDLRRLPQAIDIARGAMGLVKQNLGFVVVPNGVGLVLAATGAIGPAVSTLLNNGSAICAGVNSMRPLLTSSKWSDVSTFDAVGGS